jgi:hypothetical protein
MGSTPVAATGATSDDLAWLIAALWEREQSDGAVRVTVDGTVPAGYRPLERFAVVPDLARARFLVPLASRRAAWASLSRYNTLRRFRNRVPRRVIGAGMRAGIAQRLLRDRLTVCVADGVPDRDLPARWIGAHLRELLDVPRLTMAIGVGARSAFRKPTLQLVTPDGQAIGYAKLGCNPVTRSLARNEARALAARTARPLARLATPRLLAAGAWNGLQLVVSTPLPVQARRYRPFDVVPPLEVTREIAGAAGGVREWPLASSPYWRRVRSLVEEAAREGDGELTACARGYARSIEQRWGATTLSFGAWHGDWVSWNLAVAGGRLFAWDWEYCADDVPLGLDLPHWHFQMAFVRERRGVAEAVARASERGRPLLERLGMGPAAAAATTAIYPLEILLREYGAVRSGATWTPRLYPDMLRALPR